MNTKTGNTQLQSEIVTLKDEVEAFNVTSENADAIYEYQQISELLSQLPSDLKASVNKAHIVRHPDFKSPLTNKLNEEEKIQFHAAKIALNTFIDHWDTQDYNARQGNSLGDFQSTFKKLTLSIKEQNSHLWTEWVDENRSRFFIEENLLDAQRGLDDVENRRNKFKAKRESFEEKVKLIPYDIAAIKDLRGLVENLIELLNQMNHDVPEEVKIFFDKVSGFGDGALISLLTPEVYEYLRVNGALDNFVVRRVGSRRGY